MIRKISILGSGNVAWHIARKLYSEGVAIDCVFSRNAQTGKEMASAVDATYTGSSEEIPSTSDAYLFMMSDTANEEFARFLSFGDDKILIHTSGSLSADIFADASKNFAVMYPFQTFSRNIEVEDFCTIPICIDASNAETFENVKALACKISQKIYSLDFEQRRFLHVAGVFAANFMNHSVHLGQKLLSDHNIPIDILNPLLRQSFAKILFGGAFLSQTGPAARGDREVVETHRKLLENDKLMADIYALMSESILKTYKK